MDPARYGTDFSEVVPAAAENALSRRYLALITRWIPHGLGWFEDWPGRPDCGHFFGGALWYGQDTAFPILLLASAASSPEFDPVLAGASAQELHLVCRRGLRYLCFTHDTGPADCVRPAKTWGRDNLAGTKWGERGKGFFQRSQCGRVLASLFTTAALIRHLLGHEERAMLATIAEEYAGEFGRMAPRSGIFLDTQTEENAWTALGVAACVCLLPRHPDRNVWEEHMKRWFFCATTRPEDRSDRTEIEPGRTVRDLCGKVFTTLPDGTAENHGVVHPSYMASSINLTAMAANLLKLYGRDLPPQALWRRRDTYELVKWWADETGAFQPVQGMDWPYLNYPAFAITHAFANLHLADPDAALLERRALEVLESSAQARDGRMVAEDVVAHCGAPQDPPIMYERMAARMADAYLLHRLGGPGQAPADPVALRERMQGVRVYPHGGALVHRHARGQTSFAWRNSLMTLPWTREGLRHIGPLSGSLRGKVRPRGVHTLRPPRPVLVRVREGADRAAAVCAEDLFEGRVRRQYVFASLPDGRALVAERFCAHEALCVEELAQGPLSVLNDAYFAHSPDREAHRTVYWAGGERVVSGYAAPTGAEDVRIDLGREGWLNVDDRFGLVFRGTGRAEYHNRHRFETWRATDDLVSLGKGGVPFDVAPGAEIAHLVVLWCPEETHGQTAAQPLAVLGFDDGLFAAEIAGWMVAANFSDAALPLPRPVRMPAGEPLALGWGVEATAHADAELTLRVAAEEPALIPLG